MTCQQNLKFRLMSCIAAVPDVHLVMVVDARRYDETPLKVRAKTSRARVLDGKIVESADILSPTQVLEALKHLQMFCPSESSVAKLLQVQSGFSVLVRIGAKYIAWRGSLVNHLMHLEKNSAEVLLKALHACAHTTEVEGHFQTRLRLVTPTERGATAKRSRTTLSRRPIGC